MIIQPPLRSADQYGQGHYHASRGSRLHNGVDVACYPGSIVTAIEGGEVTKIGRPYYYADPYDKKESLKNALRYVQVTSVTGLRYRYFYVDPLVKEVGHTVFAGDQIGMVQDLIAIYGQGMTNHCHVEIMDGERHIDPTRYVIG